jgi:hypothetical protein
MLVAVRFGVDGRNVLVRMGRGVELGVEVGVGSDKQKEMHFE